MIQKILAHLTCIGMVLLGTAPALAQQQTRSNYGPHMWDGGWHGWFFGPIMMIVFLAIAVAVVVLLVRWLGGNQAHPHHHVSPTRKAPLDILKERFAKGEIDKEEFEERRRILDE